MSYVDINRPLNSALPRQMIPLKDKRKEEDEFGISLWDKTCMDGLEAIGRYSFFNNLSLKENYDIIQGRFILQHYLDSEDMFDLASAISQEFQLPKYLKHYDITTKAVNLLVGEYLKRPDIWKIVATDIESTNEKVRMKTELLQSYMTQQIRDEITQKLMMQGIDPNKKDFNTQEEADQYQAEIEKKYQEMTPAAIEKYMKYDYRTAAESWGQAVLTNDKERFNFREQEKIEFTDMLVADRCFSHFRLTPTGYDVEVWNPLNTFFHQSPEVRYVEDGNWAGRTFYMSKAQVLDRYGWRMSVKQQEALYPEYDRSVTAPGAGYNTLFQTWVYPFQNYDDFKVVDKALGASVGFNPLDRNSLSSIPMMTEFDNGGLGNSYAFLQNDLVQVTEGYWRSYRRLGHLVTVDEETGKTNTEIVDESFEPELFGIEEIPSTYREHTEPNTIVWLWVNQIWQGIKINENHLNPGTDSTHARKGLYLDIRPADFQFKGDYNIFNPKLPVCGGIFNNRNGRSMAIVDLLKPYQIFYNALLNQAYGVAQRNNGKFFLMDINLIPSLKDWGGEEAYEKFMTIANAVGVGVVDTSSANPNNKGNPSFQHFQVVDMTETEKVVQLFNLAMLTEQQGFVQLGITPQRQGQVTASESATGTQTAVNNSYAITETYFENFYNYKKRKLKMHLDIAQFCASRESDITLPYITSDLGNAFIKITGTELMTKDLGVYPSNSQEDQRIRDIAEQLIIKNNTTGIGMSALIGMLRYRSLTDMQKALEEQEDLAYKRQQEQFQQEQQLEQQKLQAAAEEAQRQRDNENLNKQLDRENKLDIERLKGIANEGSFSPTEDLTPLLIDQSKLAIEHSRTEFDKVIQSQQLLHSQTDAVRKNQIEKEKLRLQKEMQNNEHKLKEKEMRNNLKVEDKKQELSTKENQNQIELSNKKHQSELALKNKDLELKQKDIELAKLKVNTAKKTVGHEVEASKNDLTTQKEINKDKVKTTKKLNLEKIKKAKKPPKTNK